MKILRQLVHAAFNSLGYQLLRTEPETPPEFRHIPDADCYRPFFLPWRIAGEFDEVYNLIAPKTLVSADRCYVLWTLALQALNCGGVFLECGVYRGGTARLLAEILGRRAANRRLHLFDTFTGMPETSPIDLHRKGDFADTSLSAVQDFVGHSAITDYHPGLIPDTFSGLQDMKIAYAHVDVDIYRSVRDCCEFIYPRLSAGGIMIFDDYGFPSCPGARRAVDEFFADKPERPLVLSNAQAIVIRVC